MASKGVVFSQWETLDKEALEKFRFANRAAGIKPENGDDVYMLTLNGVRMGFIASGTCLPPFYFWLPYEYDPNNVSYVACFSKLYGYITELQYVKFRRFLGGDTELFGLVDEFIKRTFMKK